MAHWLGQEPLFRWLQESHYGFVVININININFCRPALLEDVLRVASELVEFGRHSGVISQTITLSPDGVVIAYA